MGFTTRLEGIEVYTFSPLAALHLVRTLCVCGSESIVARDAIFCYEPQDIFTLTCSAHPPTTFSAFLTRVTHVTNAIDAVQEKQQYIYNLLEEEGCNHPSMKEIQSIAVDTKYDP